MIACRCAESDRLTVLCLLCGKVHAPDPSVAVLVASVAYLAAQVLRWCLC
jgi:hypothetical protein